MSCILSILRHGSTIIATALANIGSVCSGSKNEDHKGDEIIVQPMPPRARIPRMVAIVSQGRQSFVGLAAAVAKAGVFDNNTNTATNGTSVSSSDGFRMIRFRGVDADVGRSVSARGFYNGGTDEFESGSESGSYVARLDR